MWLLGVVVRRYDILMDGPRTVRVTPEYEDTLTYGGWGYPQMVWDFHSIYTYCI